MVGLLWLVQTGKGSLLRCHITNDTAPGQESRLCECCQLSSQLARGDGWQLGSGGVRDRFEYSALTFRQHARRMAARQYSFEAG